MIFQSDGWLEHGSTECGQLESLKKDQMCTAAVLNWWQSRDVLPTTKKHLWFWRFRYCKVKSFFFFSKLTCVWSSYFFAENHSHLLVKGAERWGWVGRLHMTCMHIGRQAIELCFAKQNYTLQVVNIWHFWTLDLVLFLSFLKAPGM